MNPDQLCVKELAAALQVSTRYVYEMRRCGFPMEGRHHMNQTATVTAAVQWIENNDFRMVRCCGVVQKGSNLVS